MCESAKSDFLHLPRNTKSLLRRLEQGIIATFNDYYLRKTFKQAIKLSSGENLISMEKNNISHTVVNNRKLWQKLEESNTRIV